MKKMMFKAACAAALLVGAPLAFAQNLAFPNQNGTVNGVGQTATINFTPGADTGGFDFTAAFAPAANLTITAAAATIPNGTATCGFNAMMGTVNCIVNANSAAVDLAAGSVTVTYTAGATAGPINVTFPVFNFFNQAGGVENGTVTAGTLTLATGPSAPTVGPLPATTLPAGPINTTSNGTVPVSITGAGVPTASLALACTIPATGASAFTITSGGTQTITAPATVGPGTPIGVSCNRGAADVVATLTCTRTATPGPNPPDLTAAITCPAGTVAPNPATVPAAPGPVNLVGPPGGTATGSITFTNAGGSQAYNVTAATPSAGYTVTGVPAAVAANGTAAVGLTCTAPTTPGASVTGGTVSFTTDVAGFAPTFQLVCTSQVLSIPTLGWGGKALMVLLMLGFGLVGFQLYRRSA